jgi:hypothetical protein
MCADNQGNRGGFRGGGRGGRGFGRGRGPVTCHNCQNLDIMQGIVHYHQ